MRSRRLKHTLHDDDDDHDDHDDDDDDNDNSSEGASHTESPEATSSNSSSNSWDSLLLGAGLARGEFRWQAFVKESLVLPLMTMYFLMLLINTILRDTKDTLLVNSSAGVAAIPILKSWVTIPSSFLFFVFYSALSHSALSPRMQFITLLSGFTLFYIVFALLIYPFRKAISPAFVFPDAVVAYSEDPHRHASAEVVFATTLQEWTLGLFYIVSELWSSAVCQLMFWQVANDVMTIHAAKDLYPLIGAMGNLGLVVAGRLLLIFADRRDLDSARAYLRIHEQRIKMKNLTSISARNSLRASMDELDPSDSGWIGTLIGIAILVACGTVFIIVCYDDVYRRLRMYHPLTLQQKQEAYESIINKNQLNNKKYDLSTWEAMRILIKSQPLRLVATLVVSYGISSSVIEVSWKGQVKRAFAHTGEYSRFMGSFWTWTGLSSMACMVLSSAMLRNLGYRVTILFTPLAMLFAGGLFFAVSIYVAFSSTNAQSNPEQSRLHIAAYAGAFAVLIAKSAKYAVFDTTKEMVFIPLDKESKGIGKAAIDVVAYRLAKSGGSFALQLVLIVYGSLDDLGLLPIALLFCAVVVIWLNAALATGKLVHEASRSESFTEERHRRMDHA